MNVTKMTAWLPVTDEMVADAAECSVDLNAMMRAAMTYPHFKRVQAGLYHGTRMLDNENTWRIQRSGGPNGKYWFVQRRRRHDAEWEHVRGEFRAVRHTSLKHCIASVWAEIDKEQLTCPTRCPTHDHPS